MSGMDRRVKERLVGASILAVLIVLIVPELLSGPAPPSAPAVPRLPAATPEPVRNITVDLDTRRPPEPDAAVEAAPASGAQPAETRSAAAPLARLETPPTSPTSSISPTTPTKPASPAKSPAKPPASAGAWAVQLGTFASRANADKLTRQVRSQGFAVYVVPAGSGRSVRYRVRVGPMADRDAAAQAVAKLKTAGHDGSLVPPAP